MVFNVVTVYNKIDGYSDELHITRSSVKYAREFQNQAHKINENNEGKNVAKIDLRDFEIRKVAEYDDEKCVLTPLIPFEVVPFPPLNSEN